MLWLFRPHKQRHFISSRIEIEILFSSVGTRLVTHSHKFMTELKQAEEIKPSL